MYLDILWIASDHLKLFEIPQNHLNYCKGNKCDIFSENKITVFQKFLSLCLFTVM